LAADNFEYYVTRELERHLETLQAEVLKGNAEDWASYKYLCGQICGIHFAMQVLVDARQHTGRDEE